MKSAVILSHTEDNGNRSYVNLYEQVFSKEQLDCWFQHLQSLQFYGGKTSFGEIPREQAWFYDGGGNFGDRAKWKDTENPRWVARSYTDLLYKIQENVQRYYDDLGLPDMTTFDSILINKYRGCKDSIRAHRDSETIFGNNPTVVILSIGCPREITFQRIVYDPENLNSIKKDKVFKGVQEHSVVLPSGSLLVMGGELQKYYSHEIKKVDAEQEKGAIRYSLTFRHYG